MYIYIIVSWDYYSQYMESHKSHVPNHQPGILYIWYIYIWYIYIYDIYIYIWYIYIYMIYIYIYDIYICIYLFFGSSNSTCLDLPTWPAPFWVAPTFAQHLCFWGIVWCFCGMNVGFQWECHVNVNRDYINSYKLIIFTLIPSSVAGGGGGTPKKIK